MLSAPYEQAVATQLAPEHMRGRYMAVFGLAWGIPSIVGLTPLFAVEVLEPELLERFRAGDAAALAACIESMLGDAARRRVMGVRARERAETLFNIETNVRRTEDLFTSLAD